MAHKVGDRIQTKSGLAGIVCEPPLPIDEGLDPVLNGQVFFICDADHEWEYNGIKTCPFRGPLKQVYDCTIEAGTLCYADPDNIL